MGAMNGRRDPDVRRLRQATESLDAHCTDVKDENNYGMIRLQTMDSSLMDTQMCRECST